MGYYLDDRLEAWYHGYDVYIYRFYLNDRLVTYQVLYYLNDRLEAWYHGYDVHIYRFYLYDSLLTYQVLYYLHAMVIACCYGYDGAFGVNSGKNIFYLLLDK